MSYAKVFLHNTNVHHVFKVSFNPLSANPRNGQTHSGNLSAVANELFQSVWPICGVDT